MPGRREVGGQAGVRAALAGARGFHRFFFKLVITTGLAGGFHKPYKGMVQASASKAH